MAGSSETPELCRHFARQRCGGCSFLHVPYAEQLAAKRAQVVALLAAAGMRADAERLVLPAVASPQSLGHRASARFCLHEGPDGKKIVGLYRQGSRVVIPTADCPANVALANEVAARLFADTAALPARFYDHQGAAFQKNRLKFATIRTSPAGAGTLADAAVILSHTGVDRGALAGWLERAGLGGLCAYESLLDKTNGDSITGRRVEHVSGPATFPYRLDGEVFAIAPASFFQANHALAPALIAAATGFAADGDVLLDLYGGFGAYGFRARRRFQDVVVVDGNKAAIAALTAHARAVGAPHVRGFAALCEEFFASGLAPATAARVTHVIANPARTGMSEAVRQALSRRVFPALAELRYVSCNPASFARDASALRAAGLRLVSVQPFDMFPHADHVEVVGVFAAAP